MSSLHQTLLRQLRRYGIDKNAISDDLLKAISETYIDFENHEEKLDSIIEINNEELTLKNKQVKNILENLPGYVSWFDKNLNYIGMNKNLETLLGAEKKLIGKKIGLDFPHQCDELVKFVENFYQNDKISDHFEYSAEHNSDKKYFNVYLQKILGGNEIILNSIDVTDKIQLQNQLASEAETKLHKERLVLLGEMAAGVAHEINNPMMVVLGQGHAILKRYYKDKNKSFSPEELFDLKKRIEKIVLMSNRVSRIVQSLKLLSRDTDNDNFQIVPLEDVITPAFDLSNDKLNYHGIEFSLTIAENILINCKGGELTQVIYCLINNSIQAIKDTENKWIKITAEMTKQYCEIRITDSGQGIALDIQEKLFFPFFTTNPLGKGIGLGLSISKKIIENHNGKIYIDNTSPYTSFVIKLKY